MNLLLKVKMNKINIIKIICDHIKTLYSVKNVKKISLIEVFLFFLTPIVPAIIFVILLKRSINTEYTNIIIASCSIIAGFLFNLLALFYSIKQNIIIKYGKETIKNQLINESISNTAFNIIISFLIILCLIFCDNTNLFLSQIFNFLSIYLSCIFLLTLAMILKRMYTIIISDV